jgi:hypothetical protein
LGSKGKHFPVELGRVGAGKVGRSAGKDVERTAAIAGKTLLDRLDFGTVLMGISGSPALPH